MTYHQLQTYFYIGILLLGLVLIAFILRPYLGALVLGGVFAVIFRPVYHRLMRFVGGRPGIAALVTTALVLILVFAPLILFGIQIFREARDVYSHLTADGTALPGNVTSIIEDTIQPFFPTFSFELEIYTRQALSWLIQHLGSIFSSAAQLLLILFLSLLTLYYFLRDGHRLRRSLIYYSPLLDQYDKEIFGRLHAAVNSIIKGSLVIAILQGIITSIGFAIFGVPHAALWGSVTVVAALVPNVGTALVLVPAVLFLFLSQHPVAAIGLSIWGATAVGLLDNLLGPKLIGSSMRIHPLLILLSVLGSIQLFGAIGLVLGPLIVSLFFALLEIYPLLLKPPKTT